MNRNQIIGIAIFSVGMAIYFISENQIIGTISGIICAIGLAYMLKIMPFSKRNVNK
ncbi:hypothetical protein [Gelidibacter maritimus]|uniref:Uncharacterized protein n=1 Tax=Gelidibacter maritimus TaxID=2761487 RepID=A0A7W2M850_9FLAO|nr:hypothetical protein [Gelidibacter maritimus]MBA6154486.1 hypothetical protein [Gelidibacter maritimus]